jgi:hypothetical protein
MPFSTRPYRRFPEQCPVTYNAGPFPAQITEAQKRAREWKPKTK